MGRSGSVLIFLVSIFVFAAAEEDNNTFQGQKLSWKDDDGLEIKIIRPIAAEKCKLKSQAGDVLEQYYKLTDADGKEVGSNFGGTP
ncbi:CBR-FKB-5 protein [Ditylenchus destructor]|uniref:CBR-FKB-5 protein n=1 Tax=Ditylenchus destructor TaxID=166010 RepID=A0AAD4N7V7_9BILA|nr:CBR-FKB-5 protein [Ditylenchus destructor]